ncbi:alpha-1,4-N-acetylglucosaminyltransferase-like [Xenopus tropicalis]|uniref:Alpha-1,4-N-acetylglucosaminyltransferase-like n=1 Tax=Xenopus tropicalis TaxID=8364 RepID=A0A8J1JLX8_XENTR|nr:alpha-1,4-N-acetylglucosaminyltransferase-like [Xenopus tropicalis]
MYLVHGLFPHDILEKNHANSKRWAVIFTCMTTRAVHIEVIESMDTTSFINALRRFIAIQGPVKHVRSDRDTNFVGAAKELQISSNINMKDGESYLADQDCTWTFNPPYSSHMGGAWERMTGIAKRIFNSIFLQVNPKFERFWTHISADGCRLALIWKYGGIYMDSDFISMRPIPDVNFLAGQCSQFSSNGVFGLSHHHNFSLKSMENFVQNYNGAIWGNQGPHLFTRTLKTFCTIPDFKSTEDVKCGNISFSNPKRFYPIPFKDWKRYYDVCPNVPTFNDSYALHFWNFMNKEQKTMVPGDNTLIEHLYKQYCPTTYAALKNNEPIYG